MEGFGTGFATSSICCCLPARACPPQPSAPPLLPLHSVALPVAPVGLHGPVLSTTRNKASGCTSLKTGGLCSWPPASDQPGAPVATVTGVFVRPFCAGGLRVLLLPLAASGAGAQQWDVYNYFCYSTCSADIFPLLSLRNNSQPFSC